MTYTFPLCRNEDERNGEDLFSEMQERKTQLRATHATIGLSVLIAPVVTFASPENQVDLARIANIAPFFITYLVLVFENHGALGFGKIRGSIFWDYVFVILIYATFALALSIIANKDNGPGDIEFIRVLCVSIFLQIVWNLLSIFLPAYDRYGCSEFILSYGKQTIAYIMFLLIFGRAAFLHSEVNGSFFLLSFMIVGLIDLLCNPLVFKQKYV